MSAETDAVLVTLHETLASCSKLIEAGDYRHSDQSIAELADFLESISESLIAAESENGDSGNAAVEILTQIHEYVASPALNQEIVDALAFVLPMAAARFGCASTRSLELAGNVVDIFVERCNPRDMFSVLCEAISSPSDLFVIPGYFIPLLSGLRKVLVLIRTRHYKQVKVAVPVILNVLKEMSSKSYDEDTDWEKLFHNATGVAYSIRAICVKLEGEDKKKLHALLGLYVLQIMDFVLDVQALVSVVMASTRCLPVVLELSDLLQQCELSYIGLLTGCEVDMISELVLGDDSEDGIDCFSQVRLGAAVAVIWGYKATEVAIAAKADLTTVIVELQGNCTRRWEALAMLKHIFSDTNLSFELKEHGIKFLLCIMDGITSHSYTDHVDYSVYFATLYTGLQAIEMVIMYASDSILRKNAFSAFKKVLADIPASVRFDVLSALIKNSDSSSMVAILLGCFKEEMLREKNERNSSKDAVLNSEVSQSTPFWNPCVLELLEEFLRPPEDGPPYLPEYSDAVLSALNLYRFILITESTDNSNRTGILSLEKLHEVYKECLVPLHTLVEAEIENAKNDEEESGITCALNPVEFVLDRCIELVQHKLKPL
ncbi:hypothetical protein ABFS82_07G110400 [Erythranthe guttata]